MPGLFGGQFGGGGGGMGGMPQIGGPMAPAVMPGMDGGNPGTLNPGSMQFIQAMMNQPGANFGGGMPSYGTPFAFGVPTHIQPPVAMPQLPPPPVGGGGGGSYGGGGYGGGGPSQPGSER